MGVSTRLQRRGPAIGSWRKHGLQSLLRRGKRGRAQGTQSLDQPRTIERVYLVEHDQALLTLESERNSKARGPRPGGHWRHDHRAQVRVHFVGRDHDAGSGLLDLTALRRVELGQPDLAGLHHQPSKSSPLNRAAVRLSKLGHLVEFPRTDAKWIDGDQNVLEKERLEAALTPDLWGG